MGWFDCTTDKHSLPFHPFYFVEDSALRKVVPIQHRMANKIKLLATDIDGTLTDGMMLYDGTGNVSKSFNTRDMSALWTLKLSGVQVIVITGSNHECNKQRMRTMQMLDNLHDTVHDKKNYLKNWCEVNKIDLQDVAFIGDADNDIEVMKSVGWAACPADAIPEVQFVAQFISEFKGGQGAVYDFAKQIMKLNGTPWPTW